MLKPSLYKTQSEFIRSWAKLSRGQEPEAYTCVPNDLRNTYDHFKDLFERFNERPRNELVVALREDPRPPRFPGTPAFDVLKAAVERFSEGVSSRHINEAMRSFVDSRYEPVTVDALRWEFSAKDGSVISDMVSLSDDMFFVPRLRLKAPLTLPELPLRVMRGPDFSDVDLLAPTCSPFLTVLRDYLYDEEYGSFTTLEQAIACLVLDYLFDFEDWIGSDYASELAKEIATGPDWS